MGLDIGLASDPAAGFLPTAVTIGTGKTQILRSLSFGLITSAVAGNRIIQLLYADGTPTVFAALETPFAQAASTSYIYSFALGHGRSTSTPLDTYITMPLPAIMLKAGYSFGLDTTVLDAADQFINVIYQLQDVNPQDARV